MSVLLTLAKAAGGVIALALAWLLVDRAWRRMFPDRPSGCGGCAGCRRRCETRERT